MISWLIGSWKMCTVGQMQSPVNVEAQLRNTGQLPIVALNETEVKEVRLLNISGGPASPYNYRLHHVAFHFGRVRENERGSEHTVDRVRFPAELQLMAFNSDLYDNFTEAMSQPRGILAIAVIVDIGEKVNPELRRMTVASQSITFKDSVTKMHKFKPFDLLPPTDLYVTYEGSLTHPGCQETVTIWDQLQQQTETKGAAPVFMSPNYRPLKPLNGRLFRTNIKVDIKSRSPGGHCPSNVWIDQGYRANPKRILRHNTSLGFDSLRHRREAGEGGGRGGDVDDAPDERGGSRVKTAAACFESTGFSEDLFTTTQTRCSKRINIYTQCEDAG
ncbi:Alpha-carbonic anhydrase domain-containing protein [Aphelenchoides fujianensis]|nr:Alpha-carbonic anhydrase domain-containing protein [Aphelenchoides fujianensis]